MNEMKLYTYKLYEGSVASSEVKIRKSIQFSHRNNIAVIQQDYKNK